MSISKVHKYVLDVVHLPFLPFVLTFISDHGKILKLTYFFKKLLNKFKLFYDDNHFKNRPLTLTNL